MTAEPELATEAPSVRSAWLGADGVTEHDPELGFRFAAHVNTRLVGDGEAYTVVTNHDHLRSSRDYSPQIPAGAVRLLLLGDSFAAGDGVDNDERFSDRLERALPGLEVMNCGLPGSGTDQQLLLFRRYRQRYEYDALLLCPLVENIRRNVTRYRFPASSALDESVVVRKPFFVVTERGLELRGVPVSAEPVRLSQLSEEELAHVDFGGERRSTGMRILINRYAAAIKPWLIRLLRFQPFPEYGDPASPGWQLMRALLETIIRENGDRPTILAPLPTYIHVEHPQTENYMARFLELANDRVHVVDLLPHFLRLSPRERRRYRFPRDPHYTALGHAVIATALEQEIRQLGLIST